MATKINRNIRRIPLRDLDSVKKAKATFDKAMRLDLLQRCETLWNNLEPFRRERRRADEFTYGDQWAELITVNGQTMTQRQYLVSQGNIALQTNQIRSIVDTVTGVMIKEQNEPVCNARDRDEQQYGEIMTTTLQANCNKNQMELLNIAAMRDVLIGGLGVFKESYETRFGRPDAWTDHVDPDAFFFDQAGEDPRFLDLALVGQILDLSTEDLEAKFGTSPQIVAYLRDVFADQYSAVKRNDMVDFDTRHEDNYGVFLTPADRTKCRVIEVWTKETKPCYRVHDWQQGTVEIIDADDVVANRAIEESNAGILEAWAAAGWDPEEAPVKEKEFFIDTYWYCRFLAPDGTVIWEGESPYVDREHPYTILATPMVEGRIVGYIHDAIDHNIAINRAIVLQDWLIRNQAKGVTIVPDTILGDMSPEEFAAQWTSIDGMIFYTPKEGTQWKPEVYHGTNQTFDAARLIDQYTRLMQESTAVSGAIQGKTPYAGTSGSMYAQQTANSSTPIASFMTQFRHFMEQAATKKLKNIAQHYDAKRYRDIAGNIDGIFDNENVNFNEVGDIEYDLHIKESTETPVYRMAANDTLMELLRMGAATPEEVLKYGYFPFADKMLQGRQAREAEMQAAQKGEMGGQVATAANNLQQAYGTQQQGSKLPTVPGQS